ncbi:hypothetical protein KFL_001830210 [Klebsormidium nitens]|uniref:AAA+ ATPase domain-containing protein n=1 Tax=Klebsormidium nitens TaxID=105231 RepID=A0A1Y1I1E6_KLENI|nr:hypothetical protein KFL_001830210 [Klebsormidium nitens]|eukprot:GAQ84293.1 hypothetical protein KFL_001830210 [Klebsormidium nitens]
MSYSCGMQLLVAYVVWCGVAGGVLFGFIQLTEAYVSDQLPKEIDKTFDRGSQVAPFQEEQLRMPRVELKKEAADLVRAVAPLYNHGRRLSFVVGAEGAGKTTLLRQALLDLKATGEMDGVIYIDNLTSVDDFWDRLAKALIGRGRLDNGMLAARLKGWCGKVDAAFQSACFRYRKRTGKLPVVVVDALTSRDFFENTAATSQLFRTFEQWNYGYARVVLVLDGFAMDLVREDLRHYFCQGAVALEVGEASAPEVARFLQPTLTEREAAFAARFLGGNLQTLADSLRTLAGFTGSPDFQTRVINFVLEEGVRRCGALGAEWTVTVPDGPIKPGELPLTFEDANKEATALLELAREMDLQPTGCLAPRQVTEVLARTQPHGLTLLIGGLIGVVTILVGSVELTHAYVSYRLPRELDETLNRGSHVPPHPEQELRLPRVELENKAADLVRSVEYGIRSKHPRRDLSLVVGAEGTGKTTLLRQATLDLKATGDLDGVIYVDKVKTVDDFWGRFARALIRRDKFGNDFLAARLQARGEWAIEDLFEAACDRYRERTGKLPVVVIDAVSGRDFYEKESTSGDLLRTFDRWANDTRARVVLVVDGFALGLVSEIYVRRYLCDEIALEVEEASPSEVARFLQPTLRAREAAFAARFLGGNLQTLADSLRTLAGFTGSPDFEKRGPSLTFLGAHNVVLFFLTRVIEFVLDEGARRCETVGAYWREKVPDGPIKPGELPLTFEDGSKEAKALLELAREMDLQPNGCLAPDQVTEVLARTQPHDLTVELLLKNGLLVETSTDGRFYLKLRFSNGIMRSFFTLLQDKRVEGID